MKRRHIPMMNDRVFITGGNCRATGDANSLEGPIFPPVRQFRQSLYKGQRTDWRNGPGRKALESRPSRKNGNERKNPIAAAEPILPAIEVAQLSKVLVQARSSPPPSRPDAFRLTVACLAVSRLEPRRFFTLRNDALFVKRLLVPASLRLDSARKSSNLAHRLCEQ
jgi:hypothetical protein